MGYKRNWVPYHTDNEKTERQWNLEGYEVKPWYKKKGEERWTGHQVAIYFSDKQVRPSDTIKKRVRAKARKLAKVRGERCEMERMAREGRREENKNSWQTLLDESMKVIVFDTETTGLDEYDNYILSLSWQVLDNHLKTIDEQTRYFENPLSERKCLEAIDINGLTNERLRELGTTDKREALLEFKEAVESCGLAVAHNANFDYIFMCSEYQRLDIDNSFLQKLDWFDTMTEMTNFCEIDGGPRRYKWPRLSELAEHLDIDTKDINYHQSSSDVEVTVRCFRKIVENGLAKVPKSRSKKHNV